MRPTDPLRPPGTPAPAPSADRTPRARTGPPPSPADELLDVVDAHDRVTGQATRGEVYARGLRHRCVFVEVRDAQDRLFVHRRTATKLTFPARYDMFVGGVVGAGESYDDAALREAEEELGVRGLPRPEPLFTFHYEVDDAARARDGAGTVSGSWWSRVYQVRCELPVRPQETEVAWYAYLPRAEVERRLDTWPWVPDGLAAYHRLKEFRRGGAG